MANQPKHTDPTFRANGKLARTHANNNPNTRCRDCNLTLEQIRHTHPNATWDYGHPRPPWNTYGIECSHCNRSHGATTNNNQRASAYPW